MRWMPLYLAALLTGCIEDTQAPANPDASVARADAQVDAQPVPDARPLDAAPAHDAAPIPDLAAPDAEVPDAAAPPDAEVPSFDPEQPLRAELLDVIELDGRPIAQFLNLDPASIIEWEWRVVQRPEGSVNQPVESFFNPAVPTDGGRADDWATPTAKFFVDRPGRYTFAVELRTEGATRTTEVELDVPCDLTVRLTWHTPGDLDETDNDGSDLDLHLMHPDAEGLSTRPYDCYAANQAPDWPNHYGPSLDIDDVDGAGPESIWLGTIAHADQIGANYRIAVHNYRNEDRDGISYGPSIATVQISTCREIHAEYEHTLEATGDTWWVAQVYRDDTGVHVAPAP
jgi:hypothetical protein